jgi:ribosomal protein S18 acetylase RimI-like enzyme
MEKAMKFKINKNVDVSIDIMKEVAEWGRSKGYRVWLDDWLCRDKLINDEATENTFCVGYIDNKPACTFILQWSDSTWWPDAVKYEAAYIHKLCVRREFSGMGLVQKCLDYISQECKKKGAKYIRLDTGWDESKMKEIYTNLGFKVVEKVKLKNKKEMALFEYEI